MNRASFLRSSLYAGAGLLVGDKMWEALERLMHARKSFPSVDVGATYASVQQALAEIYAYPMPGIPLPTFGRVKSSQHDTFHYWKIDV